MRNSTKILLLFFLFTLIGGMFPVAQGQESNVGTTYYVDAKKGNDFNSGTSERLAWRSLKKVNSMIFQPGDKILFKTDCVWNGQLYPRGSGIEGAPIIIDMYGKGNKPIVSASRDSSLPPAKSADPSKNDPGYFIFYMLNQEYWEINNLELSGNSDPNCIRGMSIVVEDAGTMDHIYIKNCFIRDVKGYVDQKLHGGIILAQMGTKVKSNFNDVLIEGNLVMNVDRTGIMTDAWLSWNDRSPGRPIVNEWYPSTNVVVRENFVSNIGGDGIVLKVTKDALVEYNIAKDCNARSTQANVAMWAYNSDDTIFQFNEAYLTHGTQDGQGFDCDELCNGTIYQYNYSHDNTGGFMLICVSLQAFNRDMTIRYNVSENDATRTFQISGANENAKVYNNTFYIGPHLNTAPVLFSEWQGGQVKDIQFKNNIWYNLGNGEYTNGPETEFLYEANLFYGNHPGTEPADKYKIIEDPMLVSPDSGGLGIETVDGYKLLEGSPAIGAGVIIEDCGDRDYWGNPVSKTEKPNIGAYNGPGIKKDE